MHRKDYAATSKVVDVEWIDRSVFASALVGMALNTKEHWSNLFGIGPQLQVYSSRQFLFGTDTGAPSDPDPGLRSRTIKAYESVKAILPFSYLWITGYSF